MLILIPSMSKTLLKLSAGHVSPNNIGAAAKGNMLLIARMIGDTVEADPYLKALTSSQKPHRLVTTRPIRSNASGNKCLLDI